MKEEMDKEIKVNKEWLERLLEIAEEVERIQIGQYPHIRESKISHLLGYIKSAKFLLKDNR